MGRTDSHDTTDGPRTEGRRGTGGAGALRLPPLDAVRTFEAAARHESFTRAAAELGITAPTVSLRVKALEEYMGYALFSRRAQGVLLNARGREYLTVVQEILAGLSDATERRREQESETRLRLVAVEVFAEKWLMPRLAEFRNAHPEIAIVFETDHREVNPSRRDFDVWIAFASETGPDLTAETLFDEMLLPVCSPQLVRERGPIETAADLLEWPLLYDLHWKDYWAHWFTHHGVKAPDLSQAYGFRLYSMMVQAAVDGMGVALGHSLMIARELEEGSLISLVKAPVTAPARYILVTAPTATRKPQVRTFREWVRVQAANERRERDVR